MKKDTKVMIICGIVIAFGFFVRGFMELKFSMNEFAATGIAGAVCIVLFVLIAKVMRKNQR